MKQWTMVAAALAVVVLVLFAVVEPDSPDAGGAPGNGPSVVASAPGEPASSQARRAGSTTRTTIVLPHVPTDATRPLRLTRAMLEQARRDGRLDVRLPHGERYPVMLETDRLGPGDQWTVVGRVQTLLGPQAMVLTSGPDAVFGVLPLPDGSMMQITTTRGRTGIAAAGGMLPPGVQSARAAGPDYVIPDPIRDGVAAKAAANDSPVAPRSTSVSPVDITVLGLYSDDLVELRGSVSAAETEVTSLFAIANQAHIDSGSRVRFVASLARIAIDPSWNNSTALSAIADNAVPSVDVHRMRDDMAADLVALLRPYRSGSATCGVAFLLGTDRTPVSFSEHERYGFSVSNVTPCGPLVLAHELGHNLGSLHDRDAEALQGPNRFGAYRYSFGYRQHRSPAFSTVMAYTEGPSWIGYFSNPLSMGCGASCGVEGHADNVRGFNATGPVIAGFRSPPGTLSIIDTEIHEPDPGVTRPMVFPVRLGSAAPAGGVRFDVAVTGGTARAGIDYRTPNQTTYLIPEGERETGVSIEVIGDADQEPDETVLVQVTNVIGARLLQGEAIGTILNDDPRTMLSGRVRFPGAPAPDSAFQMTVIGADGNRRPMVVELSPPAFAYSVPVVQGASVELETHPPPPFAAPSVLVEKVETPTVRDIMLRKGWRVSGRLTWPAGRAAPTSPIGLTIKVSIDDHEQALPISLEPPDFRYSTWVAPGTRLYFEATPPAPYQPLFAIHSYLDADLVQDIPLSELPGLVISGGGRTMVEGFVQVATDFVVQLSAPAPAGGVRMRYRTVDGTARAGIHYTPVEGTIEIPQGETRASTAPVGWSSDAVAGGEKDFHVVVSDVIGANPVVTRIRIVLTGPDRQMSDPFRPRRRK